MRTEYQRGAASWPTDRNRGAVVRGELEKRCKSLILLMFQTGNVEWVWQ
jgi:hypothetical protein